jgi:hypothetical protein
MSQGASLAAVREMRLRLVEVGPSGSGTTATSSDWPSVATAVRYFELNTGGQAQPFPRPTRLRAFRLPEPRQEPTFETFTPFPLEQP